MNYSTFAYQEVKGVKEVKELRRMSCCLKNYAKKTVVLTPLTPYYIIWQNYIIWQRRLMSFSKVSRFFAFALMPDL